VSRVLDEVVAGLGDGAFDRAASAAWTSAARTGRPSQAELAEAEQQHLFGVADDLAERIWELDQPEATRVALLVELYQLLPSSAVMFVIAVHYYPPMTPAGRELLWERLRVLLDSEDERLADPISYYLWAEYFEDPDPGVVEEVWHLVVGHPADRALRRVLEYCGPVPVELKRGLVASVIDDVAWHRSIFQALIDSRTAIYGRWDAAWAQQVFDRLREPQLTSPSVEDAIEEFVASHNAQALREGMAARPDVDFGPIRRAFDDLLGPGGPVDSS
jgi:hypothetical protein